MKTEIVTFSYRGREFKLLLVENDWMTLQIKKLKSFYESSYLTYLLNHKIIGKDTSVVDVGAFLGNHTVFFGAFCSHVISFEPCGESYRRLVENISLNELENVDAYRKAVGNGNGSVDLRWTSAQPNTGAKFWWYSGEEGMNSWYNTNGLVSLHNMERCEVVALDKFLNGETVDFLKIDVEGMEFEVLKGARDTIKEQSPIIMIEVWKERTDGIVADWMKSNGYKIIHDKGWGSGKRSPTTWLIGK